MARVTSEVLFSFQYSDSVSPSGLFKLINYSVQTSIFKHIVEKFKDKEKIKTSWVQVRSLHFSIQQHIDFSHH
jgi:hypothetical protein